jgi:serine/threonine-protein kinase
VAADGLLTLDTAPWTRVSLNGRDLGTTPLVRVRLPAGTHTLTLRNPELGVNRTVTVVVRADETTARRLDLNEP